MFEVPWVLDEHLKEVVRRRKNPQEADDEVDWDDEDKFDSNELADQVNWR